MLIGIDEAGMGTLAGPMTAAVVALPSDVQIKGVRDSKKMTSEQREEIAAEIMERALFYKTGSRDAAEIDARGLSRCWLNMVHGLAVAAKNALDARAEGDVQIIIDGNRLIGLVYVLPVVKADATHLAVSAASILAKYVQVCAMLDLHEKYPRYGFNLHHGYSTAEHKQRLKELGPCPEHRKSFRPVKNLLSRSGAERT